MQLQRTYYLKSDNNVNDEEISLIIRHPEIDSVNGDWYCEVSIQGTTINITERAFGIDALQSLTIAINQLVPLLLTNVCDQHQAKLFYLDACWKPDDVLLSNPVING